MIVIKKGKSKMKVAKSAYNNFYKGAGWEIDDEVSSVDENKESSSVAEKEESEKARPKKNQEQLRREFEENTITGREGRRIKRF